MTCGEILEWLEVRSILPRVVECDEALPTAGAVSMSLTDCNSSMKRHRRVHPTAFPFSAPVHEESVAPGLQARLVSAIREGNVPIILLGHAGPVW